MIIIKLFNSEC